MPKHPLLEICVESLDRAAAAERGGADRIELCADLAVDGITPSVALMHKVRHDVRIPIHVLIRPRAGDFCYSKAEFEKMKREIDVAKDLGMDGIVLGILDNDNQIDQKRTSVLIRRADPLPVTFHRAFDLCRNLPDSLQLVIETGAKRVLTSGGKSRATAGLESLAELVMIAKKRILIMPGGGVRAHNIERILRKSRAPEVHSSLRINSKRGSKISRSGSQPADHSVEFEARVRKLRKMVEAIPQ
jgi:copper homeostasis protein